MKHISLAGFAVACCMSSVFALGLRFGFAGVEDVGAGISFGGYSHIELSKGDKVSLLFYPGADLLVATGDNYSHFHNGHYDRDINALEMTGSADLKINFQIDSRVDLYFGPGMSAGLVYFECPYENNNPIDIGFGLDLLGGLTFPVLSKGGGMEMRGKIGGEFDHFKLLFCVNL